MGGGILGFFLGGFGGGGGSADFIFMGARIFLQAKLPSSFVHAVPSRKAARLHGTSG